MFFRNALTIFLLVIFYTNQAISVRLTRLFQLIDGYSSEGSLRGFLHVGNDYAVFLRAPQPNDKLLTYELYEARNEHELSDYKPRLLAVSEIPIKYIKDQLIVFRSELYTTKYISSDHVPGVLVRTTREWQMDQVLKRDGAKKVKLNNFWVSEGDKCCKWKYR